MKLRKIIFWLHLTAGLSAGMIVFVMSVTGVLLAFERQMIDWAERDLRVTPPANAMQLSVNELIAAAQAAAPDAAPSGFTLRSDPAAPAAVAFGRERTIFVSPYTGAVLGDGSKRARAFFQTVTNIHRWLGVPDKSRATGRAITGACNLAFLFLVISGFYLWWPRKWAKNAGRAILTVNVRLRSKARNFHWHNAFGFWSAPILFLLVLSGVLLSYEWATNLLYRVTGSELPPVRAAAQNPSRPRGNAIVPANIDRLWDVAAQQVPDWKTITARFETSPSAPLTFSIARGHQGRPDLRGQLTLNPETAEVVRWEPFSSFNLGRQLRSWGRFVHTGEAGGIVGQIIAALASAVAATLVWTGFALAWRRFRERTYRRRVAAQIPKPMEALP
jgi:uncharacterized iron-regulated membrane protein